MNKFAKRHYEQIAEAMQCAVRNTNSSSEVAVVWKTIGELAMLFARDNDAFKRDRFLKACYPGANVKART
jgi:hypothetical protein